MMESLNLTCATCGKTFIWVKKSGRNNIGRGFCNRGPAKYCEVCRLNRPYSYHSQEIREKTFKRFDNKCQKCGKSDGKLIVHHIDFDECNNSEQNLILLCQSCHAKIEHFFIQKVKEKGFLYEWFNEWLKDKAWKVAT